MVFYIGFDGMHHNLKQTHTRAFITVTALDLIDENEHRRVDLQRYVLQEEDLFCSAKFESLRELLPTLVFDGHRILIFSSWTSCLDLLGCLMQHLGILFLRMDGSCPSDVRQELIDRFNSDTSLKVFLLSTKACGLGINLTSADTCIIHDLDFNPFNDLQAEDRCHRIGQKKPVTVYKLISKDTVDEAIFKMQEKKASLVGSVTSYDLECCPTIVVVLGVVRIGPVDFFGNQAIVCCLVDIVSNTQFSSSPSALFDATLQYCEYNTGQDERRHNGLGLDEKGKERDPKVRPRESRTIPGGRRNNDLVRRNKSDAMRYSKKYNQWPYYGNLCRIAFSSVHSAVSIFN